LLNRADASDTERIDEFIRAIERHDGYESYGGLYELGQFLEHCQDSGKRISGISAERLRRVLGEFPVGVHNCQTWVEHLVYLVDTISP
jgi:hypothetical protein